MRTALGSCFLFALPVALVALAQTPACTNGNVTASDAGTLPDGAPIPTGEGGAPSFACVFEELQTFSCPGITLAPPVWTPRCVNGDTCKSRVNGSGTSAGCTQTTAYQDVKEVPMSCDAWQASGAPLPVIDSGPAPVCAPGSVSSFTPKWHPPRAKAQACTKTQIDSYLKCLDDAAKTLNPPSCNSWSGPISSTDSACLKCLSSNESDATYGPLVLLPTELLINVAGCIALAEGKTDGSGCGGSLQADQQCTRAACLPSCPTGSPAQIGQETTCEASANGSGGACATFSTAAQCAGAIQTQDAGTAAEAACFGTGTSDSEFEAVSLAFCGMP